ncbi:MAG: hypothetical protein KGL18_21445 [Burkholderiales bacterium]|nr:hypothetical protein [Burkholderiales bacterium]MDE1926867.1 hypothetical protein [Burkholderiales bacterium]MDE2505536.1 hypothetical protein [Burkholderiales bacterium]
MTRPLPRPAACLLSAAALLSLAACTPTLDWRVLRPEGTSAELLFPCRPKSQHRQVVLAGRPTTMVLYACDAGDRTWGLIEADVVDPTRVGPALQALRQAAAANLGAALPPLGPLAVPGATPNDAGGTARLSGRRPDGQAVQMRLALFAHGTQVFQATVLGAHLAGDAEDGYFAAIRLDG